MRRTSGFDDEKSVAPAGIEPGDAALVLRVMERASAIDAALWDRLASAGEAPPPSGQNAVPRGNPFTTHAFYTCLEDSGCVGQKAGWMGQHLVLEDGAGSTLAIAPAYLKGHSQGEYVFDHGWADAFQRAGGRYYPKLQLSVPFTPAKGPRLLVGDGPEADGLRRALCRGIASYVEQTGVSSAHSTFLEPGDLDVMVADGFLHRTDQQFHFRNRGYRTYEDFLETLASRKRKGLRKERREATSNGITIRRLTGQEIGEADWDAFYVFYMDTGSRKWGRPYLNRAFFSLIGERLGNRIVLVMAYREGKRIAGALNFVGGDTIFGRYWGCVEDHPCLHFEVCYHQAIDFAIEHGLATVEAGAQGEHKLARGYEPVTTHSAHYIGHPGLKRAVADHLDHERREIERINQALGEHTPFRRGDPSTPPTRAGMDECD